MVRLDEEVFGQPLVRLLLVLWGVGYVQVDISAWLLGRTPPGIMFLTNLPLYVMGFALSLFMCWLITATVAWNPTVRWPFLGLVIVLIAALHTAVDLHYLKLLSLTLFPDWQSWALNVRGLRYGMALILYSWTYVLAALILWASRATDQARFNAARAAAFEAAALRAEAAALRLQLNPHFLFNTLNGIASLVVSRHEAEAEAMIDRLADFLRASLVSDPTSNVPLADELETVRAYLSIEEARFPERMSVSFAVDESARSWLVPNFILQPLIENAVKYGVAPSRRPVHVEVRADIEGVMLVLTVANRVIDGSPLPLARAFAKRGGIGLANTRQRLALAYEGGAWLTTEAAPDGFRASIGLPNPAPATLSDPQAETR
ncbi:histidine kinase [Sphingomonas sp.]|uniref:sensor histidine kinase n=1 Tax=Sphingomonas sp. TaxID=28214 RepID=UPI001ECADC43|nr:histidine kinase [Sphingomonas sp.]MBX3593816.1 histidine kinase [Sphingomonas sp.]